MRRKLLMVSYYYPPLGGIGAQRSLQLARYLPEFGWDPVIVTPRSGSYALDPSLPSYGEVVRTASLEIPRLVSRLRGGGGASSFDDIREGTPEGRSDRFRRWFRTWAYIPDPCVGWYPFARHAAMRQADGVDAIWSTSSPATAHLVARGVARRAGIPWVADYRDLWTRSHYPFYDSPVRMAIDRRLEAGVLEDAHAITTVSEPWRDVLREGCDSPERFHVVENGFDPDDFEGLPTAPTGPAPPPSRENPLVIVYVGMQYGAVQSPEPLLDVIRDLLQGGQIAEDSIEVQVFGTIDPHVGQVVARLGLEGVVKQLGFRPRSECLAAQRRASVNWLIVRDDPRSLGHIPGKLFEYLGSGRPILAEAPAGGEVARIVGESGGGWVVPPADRSALRVVLERVIAGARPTPSDEVANQYTRRASARRMARVLDSVVR